jgi:benzoylformate decarboxylase
MADGYAQATRNAGFVNLHSAAGVGNALGNIYTAHRNQTPLVITAGQQARSILPLQAFLYAERASEFPRPYVKYSVEPARAEDVPAAIARAYYVAMQPPCGPTFVSVPIDDWTHQTQAIEARCVSRELGPDASAMEALVNALAASKRPALVVGPGVDRAQAVDLMVRLAEKTRASVWVSPFSARCSFPERHPQFAGFLHASPSQLSDALREHDLVVVIGAPVFTFHVEGHAAIFDGATTIFQITDDSDAASVSPVGTSIIATMKPALAMLLELLPETKRAMPAGRILPPAPKAADPIPVEYLLHALSSAMPGDAVLVEEAPSHRPAMQKFMPMRGQDSFYTMASGGSQPARRGRHGARPPRTDGLPDRRRPACTIQCCGPRRSAKLPLTVVVINNAGQVRCVIQPVTRCATPGLDLRHRFRQVAEGMGCDAVRVSQSSELAPALRRGLAHDGVSLIEVTVDSAVPLLYAPKG